VGELVNGIRYWDIHEAAAELERRKALKPLVDAWWRDTVGCGNPPLSINGTPAAMMARHVATFRYEDGAFVTLAEAAKLLPFWIQYTGDKLVSKSNVKRSLLNPVIIDGKGRSGGPKNPKSIKLAPVDRYDGHPICAIDTSTGKSLVRWHNEHQDHIYPGALRTELSPWLKHIGNGGAADYYESYIAMTVAHVILMEDYHGGESGALLDSFTRDIFEPAYHKVRERFGVDPLIVRLPWFDMAGYYPSGPNWRDHGIVPNLG
jgi:hypothetical protein